MFKASARIASTNVTLAKTNHIANPSIKIVGKCIPSTLVGDQHSLGKGINAYVDDREDVKNGKQSSNPP